MGQPGTLPGFLAALRVPELLAPGIVPASSVHVQCGSVHLAHWGLRPLISDAVVLPLSPVRRDGAGVVSDDTIEAFSRNDPGRCSRMLPPFAVAVGENDGVVAAADSMGFRQLYHSGTSAAHPIISSSALVAARFLRAPLDEQGVAVQSLLGWQLGQRTLHSGLTKLAPGSTARIGDAGLVVSESSSDEAAPVELDEAVRRTAAILRSSLSDLLDEYPDAVLQLTGGQDSRILLSAIPPSRRRGLRAMTLGSDASGDVVVARALAARDGIDHEVHGMADFGDITPEEAWARCSAAAQQLDALSDPIALAALDIAEDAFEQGVRLSGLGGEVARGFYYTGRVVDRAYSRRDAEQLASWRLFANDSVEPGLLTPEFSSWARDVATDEVYLALRAGGDEWFAATDHLYLRHRMQRWAGVTDTAVIDRRVVVNPMLTPEFLSVAGRLRPRDKANSRYLARLQMELDPQLGSIPLEGRPAPRAYAYPTLGGSVARSANSGRRLVNKAIQRVRKTNRPPAGGALLASRVVDFWRAHPDTLDTARLPFVERTWIDSVLAGTRHPRPSSVAFLICLLAASAERPTDSRR